VGLITPHHTYLTITKTRKGRPRPDPGCSATDDDDCIGAFRVFIVINTINMRSDFESDTESTEKRI
jgi:hypothetical protein